jgi:translation initiation factor 2 gamma subunit (eIF-2gamma)
MPDVLSEIDVTFYLLKRLLGVKAANNAADGEKVNTKVKSLEVNEILMINVGS